MTVATRQPRGARIVACLLFISAALASGTAGSAAPPPELPTAIFSDPAADLSPPASSRGIQFRSHGQLLNAELYLPAGPGPHPLAILAHGLPGNEQNLDLAQALRRAGWAVITFHYTGSWGSGGRFTLRKGIADLDELLAVLRVPAAAAAWHVDATRIVVVGHSFGGYVAARAVSRAPRIMGLVLIAPWDISKNARALAKTPSSARERVASETFDDVDGRLAGATHRTLFEELLTHGPSLNLPSLGSALAERRVLLVSAARDDEFDDGVDFREEMQRAGASHFESHVLDTDHAFSGKRIALASAVLTWMTRLPGAPQ